MPSVPGAGNVRCVSSTKTSATPNLVTMTWKPTCRSTIAVLKVSLSLLSPHLLSGTRFQMSSEIRAIVAKPFDNRWKLVYDYVPYKSTFCIILLFSQATWDLSYWSYQLLPQIATETWLYATVLFNLQITIRRSVTSMDRWKFRFSCRSTRISITLAVQQGDAWHLLLERLSVLLSVCLSHSWGTSKQFRISYHTIEECFFKAKFRNSEFKDSSWTSRVKQSHSLIIIIIIFVYYSCSQNATTESTGYQAGQHWYNVVLRDSLLDYVMLCMLIGRVWIVSPHGLGN